jgi:hypothetical protein
VPESGYRLGRVEPVAGTTRRTGLRLAVLCSFVLAASGVLADPNAAYARQSVSGQAQSCGYGGWFTGDIVSFNHVVGYTVQADEDHGYVVDCYSGTDAYFEYHGQSGEESYAYAVWGQLGDYIQVHAAG